MRRLCMFAFVVGFLGGCAGGFNLPATHRPASYTVHRGDTLYSIAWHYGLDYQDVARWNGISSPYTIQPGEHISLYPHRRTSRPVHSGKTVTYAIAKSPQPAPAHANKAAAPAAGDTTLQWQWPASGDALATFGKNGLAGKGVVIVGKLGEPVTAAASGTVVYAGDALVGYGWLVIVKHNDEWLSAYGHNQRLLVREGQQVKSGEKIATMGVAPDGKPSLYFEIRRDGAPVNPLRFLPGKR
ncbi:MAG: peptidoglycan DD-metalloendopeptidase family protein [Gammaproteobacteria bacterium]